MMKWLISATSILVVTAAGAQGAGKILTNDFKMTLYVFDKDANGKSNCNGECAANWPPYAEKVAMYNPANGGPWTVITRDDGKKMWAYEGKPVYTFKNDKAPGDTKGDGVNGVWHIVKLP
jgi:predicted lipoprotein with Yx(FWY)xxD motif